MDRSIVGARVPYGGSFCLFHSPERQEGHSVLWASRQLQLLCTFWIQSVTAACELRLSGGWSERWGIWAMGDLSGRWSERWGIWVVGNLSGRWSELGDLSGGGSQLWDLSGGRSEWWVIWAWGIWVVGNGAAWMGSISNQFTVLELFKTAPHLLKEWTVARQNLCCDWSRSCFHYFLSCRWCYIPGPTRVTLEEGVWKIHGTWCLGKLSQALREDWLG